MQKVILNLAMSIDGYIADQNEGLAWLHGDGSSSNGTTTKIFTNFLNKIEVIVMGYGAYKVTSSFGKITKQFPNKKIYVMTSKTLQDEDIEVFKGSPQEFVASVSGTIWMFGGGYLANSFFKADLITHLEMAIVPTLLGSGVKMFHEHPLELRWKLESTTIDEGLLFINYSRQKV